MKNLLNFLFLKRTKDRVVVGWNGGVTGPTTPSCSGVTVREAILRDERNRNGNTEPISCEEHYVIVSNGKRTIAIFPCQYDHGGIEEAKTNAEIFANILNSLNGE